MSCVIHDWRYQTEKFLENFGQVGHWKKRRVCAKCGAKQVRGCSERDMGTWFDSLFAVLHHGYTVNLKNEDEWSRDEKHGQYKEREIEVWMEDYYKKNKGLQNE